MLTRIAPIGSPPSNRIKGGCLFRIHRDDSHCRDQSGRGFVFMAAAWKIGRGALTIGDLAVFIQLLPRGVLILIFVGAMMAQRPRVGVATDRIGHLLVDAPKY